MCSVYRMRSLAVSYSVLMNLNKHVCRYMYDQDQISEHIHEPNGGYCLYVFFR